MMNKLLQFGTGPEIPGCDRIPFGGRESLLDYDAILFCFGGMAGEFFGGNPGGLVDNDNLAEKIERQFEFRRGQIEQFRNLGRPIFAFISQRCSYNYLLSSRVFSRHFSGLLGTDCSFEEVILTGTRMRTCGSDALFREFAVSWGTRMAYTAHLKEGKGAPFLVVDGTEHVVATHIKGQTSDVVLLPHLDGKSTTPPILDKFRQDLLQLAEKLVARRKNDFTLPAWASVYVLPGEQPIKEQFQDAEAREKKLVEEKRALCVKQAEYDRLKVMLSEKGDVLHAVTLEIFKELGFTAGEGDPGRDDIIAFFKGLPMVGEVKGTNSSAAEKHAAQLEKWVADYKEKNDVTPKGILIVNAFHDVPLDSRSQAAFPAQMIPYSTKRDHCLITTRQLLGLLFEARKNPKSKDQLVQTLFDTVGVYKGFENFPA